MLKAAAILLWIGAFGLGIPCIMAIRNLSAGKPIPYVFGFPAYGGGPFEAVGVRTTIPLLAGFLLVCIADGVAGWLVWRGQRSGAILATVTLVPGAIYWWGFALPIPPIMALVRTALLVASWKTMR